MLFAVVNVIVIVREVLVLVRWCASSAAVHVQRVALRRMVFESCIGLRIVRYGNGLSFSWTISCVC